VNKRRESGRGSEPVWIDERDALAIHGRLLALDGGLKGVRDRTLLQSAVARPQQLFAYGSGPEIAARAAAYTFGIFRNHPFSTDISEPVSFLRCSSLKLNGHNFVATEEGAAQAVISLAAGIHESGFAAWIRENASNR
jgi:death on curing protein